MFPASPITRRRTLPASVSFVVASATLTALFLAAGAPTPVLIVEQEEWGFAPWLLTLAFGIYAIGLLGTLLVAGRLSDYVGRRPVLLAALALQTGAMVLMVVATNVEVVIVGRLLQGIATGAATGAFSSAILELAPPRARRFASSLVSAVPAAGLGLGALAAGALTHAVADATTIVWVSLAVITALGAVAILAFPETGTIRPGARQVLRPTLAVPKDVSRTFRAATPTLAAAWMMAALFMGLVPTTLGVVFGIHNTLTDGATSFLEPAAAAIATLATARVAPPILLRVAAVSTLSGALVFLIGLTSHQMWLLDVAGIIGGVGFGTAFAGTIRSVIPTTPADRRAGVFAAIYAVSYLAFGVPAIVAGILIGFWGLTPVVVGLVTAIALLATIGFVDEVTYARRTTPAPSAA